jgi:hypothetical protein
MSLMLNFLDLLLKKEKKRKEKKRKNKKEKKRKERRKGKEGAAFGGHISSECAT